MGLDSSTTDTVRECHAPVLSSQPCQILDTSVRDLCRTQLFFLFVSDSCRIRADVVFLRVRGGFVPDSSRIRRGFVAALFFFALVPDSCRIRRGFVADSWRIRAGFVLTWSFFAFVPDSCRIRDGFVPGQVFLPIAFLFLPLNWISSWSRKARRKASGREEKPAAEKKCDRARKKPSGFRNVSPKGILGNGSR